MAEPDQEQRGSGSGHGSHGSGRSRGLLGSPGMSVGLGRVGCSYPSCSESRGLPWPRLPPSRQGGAEQLLHDLRRWAACVFGPRHPHHPGPRWQAVPLLSSGASGHVCRSRQHKVRHFLRQSRVPLSMAWRRLQL